MDRLPQGPKSENTTSDLSLTVNRGNNSNSSKAPSRNNNLPWMKPYFPVEILAKFDAKLARSPPSVPVLLTGEFEYLLDASLHLCRTGAAVESTACQRFFRGALTTAFTRNLTSEAVTVWEPQIHDEIYANCMKLVELCALNLSKDESLALRNVLAVVFNPTATFHMFNSEKQSETVPPRTNIDDGVLYARSSPDFWNPYGWLVDLLNRFGNCGGFAILQERFQYNVHILTFPIIHGLLQPFQYCHGLFTVNTILQYFIPIAARLPMILEELEDDEEDLEVRTTVNTSTINFFMTQIISSLPDQLRQKVVTEFESQQLQVALNFLQVPSLGSRIEGLYVILRVINSCYCNRNLYFEDENWLITAERVVKWMKDNGVLRIILRDSLDKPKYVEKLEDIFRFLAQKLSFDDLAAIWAAQASQNETIVLNVHKILENLAGIVTSDQLEHLFECFETSWKTASSKARGRLSELIHVFAVVDDSGIVTDRVLEFFWNLAHLHGVSTKKMIHALNCHFTILVRMCSPHRREQKNEWLDKCVEELKNRDDWTLPALKQLRKILNLYGVYDCPSRKETIDRLQSEFGLITLVINSLNNYMEKARQLSEENPGITAENLEPDGRYDHGIHLRERLTFLEFVLKEGGLQLDAMEAGKIWQCLVKEAVFDSDKEVCYSWFVKSVTEEYINLECLEEFFQQHILQIDPELLTEGQKVDLKSLKPSLKESI